MDDFSAQVFANARYIKAQEEPSAFSPYDPAPLFRKEFVWEGELREAQLAVQSPGFAVYTINGAPVTEDLFISPVSNYDHILWYNTYDVTPLLRPGRNVIGVIAGNGFLNESFESAWHYPTASWRDAPQFLLCLRINGHPAVVSDESWRVSRERSHIVFNHLRSGEYWDMRKKDDRWMRIEYDDSDWQPALLRSRPVTGRLLPTHCQPVREMQVVAPLSICQTQRGYLVDFGSTISGYAEITLREKRGTEVRFFYTEDVDDRGNPKYNDMDNPHFYPESPFHMNQLIASGETDTMKPIFSYHGFRYLLIEGMSAIPERDAVRAIFIHQDVARRSGFHSGSPVLNYIYNAGIQSTYSNMFWCLTDCPTREKLGWANDAQSSVEQTLINFDIVPLYEKWFEDMKEAMQENGSLPGIIPSPNWGFSCGPICDCLLYELPYRVYLYTGNARMLIEGIPYFERYAEFLIGKVKEDHTFSLGDWMGYTSSPLIPKDFVRDFYLLKALRITVFAHRLAGSDPTRWQSLYEQWRYDFLARYLDEMGRCTVNEQSSVAMMLMEGLYRDRQILADQLVEVVLRDGLTLTCGMVGVQYLYDALAKSGRADLAYRMITEAEPGYKTWYEHGATTLWERWDGADKGSHNHHMFSGVIAWFFKALLGIVPTEQSPAFSHLDLKPCFEEAAEHVEGTVDTVRGTFHAAWRFTGDGFVYTVTVPEAIEVTFRGQKLHAGTHEFLIQKEDMQ